MAQEDDMDYSNRSITLTNKEFTYRFFIYNKPVERKIRDNVTYYWYKAGKIHKNEKGYSGSLLDGRFEKYDLNGNLLEKGTFKKGVKDGLWKTWDMDGNLTEESSWKKGFRQNITRYSKTGEILSELNYKKGKLHGRCLLERNGKDTTVYYRNGEPHTPFFTKFKRKLRSESKENN
jgi:antitoxin component YwqK of YwqJK toxin-antitoxin module